MENTNKHLLRFLCWILNGAIAVIVVLFLAVSASSFRQFHFGHEDDHAVLSIYVTLCMRLLYVAGLVYILVLLNRIVLKVLKGRIYEKTQLSYLRRIGYLLLAAPLPMLCFAVLYLMFGGDSAGMGVTMTWDAIGNNWPYAVMGLIVLTIAEVYKVGIGYKKELDLTV